MAQRLLQIEIFRLNELILLWDFHFGQSVRGLIMAKKEFVLKAPVDKKRIKRTSNRDSGIVRVDAEACNIIDGLLDKLEGNWSVSALVSQIIVKASELNIIYDGDSDESEEEG